MNTFEQNHEIPQIIEKTEIEGLRWESNPHFKTSKENRIIIQSENASFTTVIWHGENGSDSEYPHYALHFAGDDRLTFINGKNIIGEFVDCRKDSPTLHKHIRLAWDGNPERRLIVQAGIAHWFRNLSGVVTRNEPILRWDNEPDPLFSNGVDVFNIHPTREINKFPIIQPHRYLLPLSFHEAFAKQQRKWARDIKYFPTRIQVKNTIYLLVPKEESGPTVEDLKSLPLAPT